MSNKNPHLTYPWKYNNGYDDVVSPPDICDTIDRPASAYTESTYVRAGSYDESGKKISKLEAGVGRAHVEFNEFEAEAKGPNFSFEEAIVTGGGAMARAEVASASAKAGPIGLKVGLGFDTGASANVDGVEAKFLGTGFTIGKKTSVSFLGSEASCSVM